jgi:hypothetical protein
MSIYWNHFFINVDNETDSDLTWGGCDPLTGTLQSGQDVPKGTTVNSACAVQSASDSTAGVSGTAHWGTVDNVTLGVQFDGPNAGDPSGVPSLTGANKGKYKVSATMGACDGSGCPVNSGYRQWTLTVTFSEA